MSFRGKLLLAFLLIMAVAGGSTLYIAARLVAARQDVVIVRQGAEELDRSAVVFLAAIKDLQSDALRINGFFTAIAAARTVSDDDRTRSRAYVQRIEADLAKAKELARTLNLPEVTAAVDRVAAEFPPFWQAGLTMADRYAEGRVVAVELQDFDTQGERLRTQLEPLVTAATEGVSGRLHDLDAQAAAVDDNGAALLRFLFADMAAGAVIVVLSILYLFRLITSSFAALKHDIDHIRTEGGIDGLKLSPRRPDEFGLVAAMLQEIVINRDQIKVMSDERERDHEKAQRERYQIQHTMLRSLVEAAMLGNDAMIMLSRMKQEVDTTSREVQGMAQAVEGLRESINEVSADSSGAASDAGDAGAAADHGLSASRQMRGAFEKIVGAVAATAEQVRELTEASRQIGQIVTDIEQVAGMTNLLALNATIEAARAGDAGKGFAVVANEVKTLANQTSRATDDIRGRIEHLQAEMQAIVRAMEASSASVAEGQSMADDLGGQLSDIAARVGSVGARMADISSLLERQSGSAADLARGTREVAEIAKANDSELDEVLTGMARMSDHLDKQVGAFAADGSSSLLVEVARNDHVAFKRRVVEAVTGQSNLTAAAVADHHACRLGKWYDQVADEATVASSTYRALSAPHEQVHVHAKQALTLFEAGRRDEALEAVERMNEASLSVIALLETLSGEIHQREIAQWASLDGNDDSELF